ncbi:cytochrome P450 [Kribbella sp. NPDC056861]|uniref:cytochrome P450 family protein n=1 Tax=Kribbella sp. NPDC056861 TaxID=3154857 RepID=UPI0034463F38
MSRTSEVPALFSMEYFSNPLPTLDRLRQDHPVLQTQLPFVDVEIWLISGYDDIRLLSGDDRLSANPRWATQEFIDSGMAMGLGTGWEKGFMGDPPDHGRQRRLAGQGLTPRMVARWESLITEVVNGFADELAIAGEADLVQSFGYPFAITIACEVLGVPQADHQQLRAWAEQAVGPDRAAATQSLVSTLAYLKDLLRTKREDPGEDLMSALLAATEGDDRLGEAEICAIAGGMLLAGFETAANFVCNSVVALLDNPEQLQLLRDQPDLIDGAVEELLRHSGPIVLSPIIRFATEPIELHGVVIPASAAVGFLAAAANHDPRVYEEPDRLDITRSGPPHLQFGHGPHHCVGNALARLEARIALTTLLTRFTDLRLAVDRSEVVHRISPFMFVYDKVPVRLN